MGAEIDGISQVPTLLVNSKVRVTTALHLTFKAQTDQGVIPGESDLEAIGN
jgi:hypothetical protein